MEENKTTTDQNAPVARSRLHAYGKLSFRRRVQKCEAGDEDLPLIPFSEQPPPLDQLIPEGITTAEIEVGPGKGAFVLAATAVRPETFLLGIEAAPSYAHYAAQHLAKTGRRNGLLLIDNAKLYLRDRVEDGALARLHVYFADPWPKRRHRKRRFFTADMMPTVHRILRPGGHLLVATDNAAYAGQICAVVGAHPGLLRDEAEEERLRNLEPGHGFAPTNFERKYRQEHRIIRCYAFARVPD